MSRLVYALQWAATYHGNWEVALSSRRCHRTSVSNRKTLLDGCPVIWIAAARSMKS